MIRTLYRASLRLLPAALRQEFGADMTQMFDDQWRHARGPHRARQRLNLIAAAVIDVISQAWRERRALRAARPSTTLLQFLEAFMNNFLTDFIHGVRLVRRYPGTSIIAILTLALGIGANTAIFSVVDAVLLRSLPFSKPHELVELFEKRPSEGVMTNAVSAPDFLDWRAKSTSFSAMSAYVANTISLSTGGDPVRLTLGAVSTGFLNVVGVQPMLGRNFTADEERDKTKGRVVMLTNGAWKQYFGGDETIVNRRITLNGRSWQVIGVLPASFEFMQRDVALLAPAVFGSNDSRGAHYLDVYARLKPGVSVSQARNEMDTIGKALEAAYPDDNHGHGSNVVELQSAFVQPIRARLLVLLVAVGLVMLLACVNVASLMLVRSAKRAREMSIRAAIGANRARLVVQTLAESLALAAIGGAAGIALAAFLIKLLPIVLPEQLSIVRTAELGLDLRVLAVAAVLTIGTSVLFGIGPSIGASRRDPSDSLKEGGRNIATLPRALRTGIIIGEIALASVAVVGAGLILRSFSLITAQPLGIDPHDRYTVSLVAQTVKYPTPESQVAALASLERSFAAIPGVINVGAIDTLPFDGDDNRRGVEIEGRDTVPDSPTRMHPRTITTSYFAASGMTLLKGRAFSDADTIATPRVSILNEVAANRWWAGQDPIGKRWRMSPEDPWITNIGIAANVRHWGLSRPINPMVFLAQAQDRSDGLSFVIQSKLDAAQISAAVRAAVHNVDAAMPVGRIRSMDSVVANSLRAERAQTVLMSVFGGMALLLAAVGIYGVMSQLVAARVPEIGVRVALGAKPGNLIRLIMLDSAWQAIAGLAIGIAAGAYFISLAQNLLFGIKPWDPVALILVAVTLLGTSIAACLIPAMRALKVDPVTALRN